jgi:hypothetical protein
MHFRYENVESYQANKDGNQLVLQIQPTSLGSGGGLFRFKVRDYSRMKKCAQPVYGLRSIQVVGAA